MIYAVLLNFYKDKKSCTGLRTEGHSVASSDRIVNLELGGGIFVFKKDWNASFVPK